MLDIMSILLFLLEKKIDSEPKVHQAPQLSVMTFSKELSWQNATSLSGSKLKLFLIPLCLFSFSSSGKVMLLF